VFATSLCQSVGRYPPPHGIWKPRLLLEPGGGSSKRLSPQFL